MYFDTACIFLNYLCIGIMDLVYFVNLNTLTVTKIKVDLYLGYFEIFKNHLLIASGVNVIMLDKTLSIIWKSESLADDGVIFEEITDKKIELLCINDPPNGETVKRVISFKDGSVIK